MREYIDIIKKNGITSEIIAMLIEEHKSDRERMKKQYARYKAAIEGVPILRRTPIEYEDFETGAIKRIDNKVNNRLNNAFDAEIIDTKVGYMFGHPISYESEDKQSTITQEINSFNIRSTVEDEDSEWGKKATICGYGARLAYVDTDGKERVKNINPWEVIILSDGDMTEPVYAMRYYSSFTLENGVKKEIHKVEFYDSKNIYFFQSEDGGANYTLSADQLHLFDYCPLYGLPNNEELMGDAEKVYSLIDAYDRTISDASNEIEQYRLAYLVLKGLGTDEETLDRLKRTGVLELLDEKDDVNYLTKDINDDLIEHHLDRLENNILRFAKSVNFTDESFGTSITGVAMRFKIMALENKCITMERKMTAALRYQYKVLCSAWAKKGICATDDYLKVWFGFKRNLPSNLLDEAQTTAQLRGQVSEKTRLSLLSFVDDAEFEMKEMEKERETYSIDLDKVDEDDKNNSNSGK